MQDLRLAFRQILRRPGFSAVVIVTLAIGIAVNTVAFSAVNALLLKGPAGSQVDGTGWLITTSLGQSGGSGLPEFERIERALRDVVAVAAQGRMPLAWRQTRVSETIWALLISSEYFRIIEATPMTGRLPASTDTSVVVLRERFWRERLGAAPLDGLRLNLNGADMAVIGVMPENFRGPGGTFAPDVWVPIEARRLLGLASDLERAGRRWLGMIGRLAPGVTAAQANARLSAISGDIAREWPESHGGLSIRFVSMREGHPELRSLYRVATVVMVAVGVVLLLAVFNVANLLLARAIEREREMGIRAALGAGRGRLVRQLAIEGLVLASAAGALSLVLAFWSQDLLSAFALPSPIPQRIDLSPDRTLVGFVVVMVVLAGVLPGLAPALRTARVDLVRALAAHSGTTVGGRPSATRRGLIVLQVAASTVLLTLATLFVQSFVWLADVDPGFDVEHTAVVEIDPSLHSYDASRARLLVERLRERFATLPGVASVAVADRIPFYVGFRRLTPTAVDDGHCAENTCPGVLTYSVGPHFFETMRVPLAAGREFDGSPGTASGIIVSETFARTWWSFDSRSLAPFDSQVLAQRRQDRPFDSPLAQDEPRIADVVGRVVRLGATGEPRLVIGVVRDTRHHGFAESGVAALYLPLTDADFTQRVTIVVASGGSAASLVPALHTAAYEVDPAVPPVSLKTMEQRLEGPRWPAWVGSSFFGICGALALLLATVGLFALISHSVGQRTREFGVRLAVGATTRSLLAHVLASSAWLVVPGLALGLVGAALIARTMMFFLAGVDLASPPAYLAVALLQGLVAFAASAGPARRAAHVDPLVALRAE